jgi:UDP-2,4-diacetamido-2,4,6-trideoxy-beta-L-altropyranose hydrolase
MRVAVRADAAVALGSGHVVRCLSLAEELRAWGAEVVFVSRAHDGHLLEAIAERGFGAHALPAGTTPDARPVTWLGTSSERDAAETVEALGSWGPADWLIVDHYAIDATWHARVRGRAERILAIDDLADRALDADVVLNQNFGADAGSYRPHLGASTRLLLGPRHALLAQQFRLARVRLEGEPRPPGRRNLLVSLGGTDPTDATSETLRQLQPAMGDLDHVDVVIGRQHPNRPGVETLCARHPNVDLHVETSAMADLLRAVDVAIGAGGSSTWERMCLGVPTLTLPLAANQLATARSLAEADLIELAPMTWRSEGSLVSRLLALLDNVPRRQSLAAAGLDLVDGAGAGRVARTLIGEA